MAEVKLFTTRFSPFGQRVHIALTEKKISVEVIEVDLGNKPEALLQANPVHKKIPVIIDCGKPVAESAVILEYLEDAFPDHSPLMPEDAYERSKVRFWADYVYQTFSKITQSFTTKPGTPERQAASEGVLASLKVLDSGMTSFSTEGPFFTGDKFGHVDVVLAPLCNALILMETLGGIVVPGPEELPRLHKWVEATRAYPSVSSIVPSGEESLAFLKAVYAKRAAAAAAAAK